MSPAARKSVGAVDMSPTLDTRGRFVGLVSQGRVNRSSETTQMKTLLRTGFGSLAVAAALTLGCQSLYDSPGGGSPAAATSLTQTGVTRGSFTAIQIDPRSEDSAGPVFAATGDFNNDSLLDVASAWNQSQPIQIHLQRRNASGAIAFETLPLGGTTPIAKVAGLKVADMDSDGRLDIVVLIKDTGRVAVCDPSRDDCDVTENGGVLENAIEGGIAIFFNPGDVTEMPWPVTLLNNSFLAGRVEGSTLEEGGYTSIDVGDVDGLNGPDIVVSLNSAEGDPSLPLNAPEGLPQVNTIDLWANPGPQRARMGDGWSRAILHEDIPAVGACRVMDVDRDGDQDVVCTYPHAASSNVRWIPNPLDFGELHRVYGLWGLHAPIGHISPGADSLTIGDIDNDGIADVVVRSSEGRIVQWFKSPAFPSFSFIRSPWRVFTLAEFRDRQPQAVAVGDLTGDGQAEVAISAEGAIAWFDSNRALTVYDQWGETLVIDEAPSGGSGSTSGGSALSTDALEQMPSLSEALDQIMTDPQQEQTTTVTLINSLIIQDIDGDGRGDIVGTLDRVDGSGLTNDALILFRNQR